MLKQYLKECLIFALVFFGGYLIACTGLWLIASNKPWKELVSVPELFAIWILIGIFLGGFAVQASRADFNKRLKQEYENMTD